MSASPMQSFAFEVIGNYALAQTIYAAFEAGVWEHFAREGARTLDPTALAKERGLDARLTLSIAEHLMRRGLLERSGEVAFVLGPRGRELVFGEWLGYFVHMVGGYGAVLQQTGALVTGRAKY